MSPSFERQLERAARAFSTREQYGVGHLRRRSTASTTRRSCSQGLRAMAGVWARTGRTRSLASRATCVADRLEAGPARGGAAPRARGSRTARCSSRSRCSTAEQPFDALTDVARRELLEPGRCPTRSRPGSSRPGAARRRACSSYMLSHGSRLLGLVRFRRRCRTRQAGLRAPGADDVYGTNVARFLADNDQAGPARAEPLRQARGRDDAEHVRRRRRLDDRPASTASTTARCSGRRTARTTRSSSRRCG